MANKYLLGLILTPLFVFNSHAETLDDAWEIAIANNHRIKSAKAGTTASEQMLHSAQGQRLPSLNVQSGYTQLNKTPAVVADIGGQSAQFDIAQDGSFAAEAIASVPVFTSGRISHNINAAEAVLQASQQNENTTVLNIKMQVSEAYVTVLRAESALQVAKSHVGSLEAHAKDVNNLYDQGMVARNDLLAANVEQVNAQQRVVQAGNQLDITRAGYNQLLNRDLAQEVSLAEQFPDTPGGTLKELSAEALNLRPELAGLTQQITALEQQAKSIKAGVLPQVAVNGGYQYQENKFQAHEGMWMVNVGMQWKLFDGSTRHKGNAFIQQAFSLKAQRDDLHTLISLQVRQAWLNVKEAQKRIAVTQQAIEQAEENMKVTTDRYQQGLSTNTDVLRAETLRTTTHDNFNNANFDASLSILQLRRAVGFL